VVDLIKSQMSVMSEFDYLEQIKGISKEVTIMSNSHENNQKPEEKKEEYNGKRSPMVTADMMNTSKAITGAIDRIAVRMEWIRGQKAELKKNFNSSDPVLKRTAFDRAERLAESIPGLIKNEQKLKAKLPNVKKEELAEMKDYVFPEIDV